MNIALLCRSHFVDLPNATAENIASNAWRVRIALSDPGVRKARRGAQAEHWDGAILSLDGKETEPVTGSGDGTGYVEVTALLFE